MVQTFSTDTVMGNTGSTLSAAMTSHSLFALLFHRLVFVAVFLFSLFLSLSFPLGFLGQVFLAFFLRHQVEVSLVLGVG